MELACRICGNRENNRNHIAREMMFGSREQFDYLECGRCSTLQIAEVPDLAPHYPAQYLSFRPAETCLRTNFRRRLGARFAGRYLVEGKGVLGKYTLYIKPWIETHFPKWLLYPPLRVSLTSRILDVGCGTGHLLQSMYYFGFRHLTGIDAFIKEDLLSSEGVPILKRSLAELNSEFDVIMFNHSFEHMADPRAALREARRLLSPTAWMVLRMPVVNLAWKRYGINWIQLDAPRHLFLFTETGFRQLAEETGLEVASVVYDSTAFQFWGSEQYKMDIPLNDRRSLNVPDGVPVISNEQVRGWEIEAEELNRRREGDQACFYLKRSR